MKGACTGVPHCLSTESTRYVFYLQWLERAPGAIKHRGLVWPWQLLSRRDRPRWGPSHIPNKSFGMVNRAGWLAANLPQFALVVAVRHDGLHLVAQDANLRVITNMTT